MFEIFEPYRYFFYLALFLIIYSFIGWLIDSGYKSYCYKKWTNGGFLYGPRCPIYGIPVVVMSIFVFYLRDNIFIFAIFGTIILTLWEYFSGLLLETIFHKKFWDYSDERFNYKGRICLKASLTWGVLSVLFVLFVYDPVAKFIGKIPMDIIIGIVALIYAIFITDFVISLTKHIKNRMKYLYENKEEVKKKLEKKAEEIKKSVKDKNQKFKESKQKKKNKIKTILIFLIALIGITVLLFIISLLFPGKLKFIDNIRIPIQGQIMGEVGDYLLGDFTINEDGTVKESDKAINLETLNSYLDILKSGDIFFTDSEKYVSSAFIPGKRKHSGVYLGTFHQVEELFGTDSSELENLKKFYSDKNDKLIIDAGKYGVQIRKISELSNLESISFLTGLITFELNVSKEDKIKFLDYAISQEGKKYNYDMTDIDEESFYCSQLINKSLEQIGIEIEPNSKTLGRIYTSPQDIVDNIISYGLENEKFKLIFELGEKNENK